MKTKEELNALKEEVEALNKKLCELTDEEMEQVAGGNVQPESGYPNPGWINVTRPDLEWRHIIRSDPKWCDIE